jgi:hypothetical protein
MSRMSCSSRMDLERFPLLGAPLSMSHHQIFRLGSGETRRCKINLEDEHGDLDCFRPSHGVIALCLVFVVLCWKNLVAQIGCGLLLLQSGESPCRYGRFPILLQLP